MPRLVYLLPKRRTTMMDEKTTTLSLDVLVENPELPLSAILNPLVASEPLGFTRLTVPLLVNGQVYVMSAEVRGPSSGVDLLDGLANLPELSKPDTTDQTSRPLTTPKATSTASVTTVTIDGTQRTTQTTTPTSATRVTRRGTIAKTTVNGKPLGRPIVNEARDRKMYRDYKSGKYTYTSLAQKYGISPAAASNAVLSYKKRHGL